MRTAWLLATAAVLGIVVGGGAGYAVQAARKPTPPPSLAARQPAYPATRGAAPRFTAAQDDEVKTDGDLTKLIVQPPAHSESWVEPPGENGWLTLSEFAEGFTKPGDEFTWELQHGFRRAAVSTWMEGQTSYRINLIQYRHEDEGSVDTYISSQDYYFSDRVGGAAHKTQIPGTDEGAVYAGTKRIRYQDGSGSFYPGYALARHGDIVVEIFVDSPHPVGEASLMSLVQSQLERL